MIAFDLLLSKSNRYSVIRAWVELLKATQTLTWPEYNVWIQTRKLLATLIKKTKDQRNVAEQVPQFRHCTSSCTWSFTNQGRTLCHASIQLLKNQWDPAGFQDEGRDYGREGNSFCLLEEPFQGIFMVLTATRTMQMYANVYMWSTCGHNRTKTSLWQIVHLHAFKFIMHLSPHTARLASQAFSNLPPRAFRLRMLRLKASHGKSKSFHQAGSIPEWPEALCHNSADALPESKVEQESALVKYIYIYILYIKMQCGIQSYCHIQILCGQCSKFMGWPCKLQTPRTLSDHQRQRQCRSFFANVGIS